MFALGARSKNELLGVDELLVSVVNAAIQETSVDFAVTDGIRTIDEQRKLVAKGASKTMNSKHLIGEAVDLTPCVDGKPRWEWPLVFVVAKAVQNVARRLGVRIRWGGVWDRCLNDLSDNLPAEVEQYKNRHEGTDFLDGPHFELMED